LYVELKKQLDGNGQENKKLEPIFNVTDQESGNSYSNKNNHRLYSGPRAGLESLVYFLQKGYLPWWASGSAVWDEQWLQKLTASDWERLNLFLLSGDENPSFRLATQFSAGFLFILLKGLGVSLNTIDAWDWL